jgi:3-oxoacyl-(acyl-carrier-protein) synthase
LPRVAITGLGAVCALGHRIAPLWAAVIAGKVGIGPIANVPTDRLTVKIAAEVKDFDPLLHFEQRQIPMLDRAAQFALVAAREAIADSGISLSGCSARAGVILGATGGWQSVDESYERFYGQGVNRLPAISSSKSMFGHNLAAAGALEMIVTAMALKDGIVPPTMNYDEEDPDCMVDCVPGEARRTDIDTAMSNSFAFGGLNAVLLARRFAS